MLPRTLFCFFRRNSTTITTTVAQKARFYGFTGLVIINLILLTCVCINLSQLSSYNDTLENTKILNKILISKAINETKLEEAFQRTRIVVESSNLSIYISSTLYALFSINNYYFNIFSVPQSCLEYKRTSKFDSGHFLIDPDMKKGGSTKFMVYCDFKQGNLHHIK